MFFECKLKKERYERRGRCGGGDDDDYGRRGHREQRCGRSGCRQKCAYSKKDGIKIYTSYCCDHACLLGAHRCQLMKEKGESYCHIHECTYPGCASFAERGSRCAMHAGGSSSLFCSVGGCPGLCGPHSLFCEPHAAAERGGGGGGAMPMPMPMPMPGHNMAPSGGWNNAPHPPPPHAAAAGMMPGPFFEGGLGAFPAAQPGVHQCDAHCTEHRHSNKAAQPESFCRTPGCQRLRRATGDSEWCETHTCEVHACAQRRSDRHASMRTCERHACAVARCDRAAQPPGAFCRVHGCAADTCGRFRDADGGGGGSGGWFCAEHECRRPRCLERVAPGADFCPRHLADREEEEVVVERRRRRAPGEQRYGQQQQWRRRQTCGDGMAAPRVVIFQGDAGDGCGCGGGRQGGRRHRRDRSLSCGEDEDGCRCEGSCDRDGGMFRRVYHDK